MKLVRSGAPLTAEVDGELVMLDPRTSNYFGLDGVGHRIWELLEEPTTVDAMVSKLVSEYEVEPDRCTSEVAALVDELVEVGLVERIDS